ncbi:release factor glutamine methyltransferase [Nakamurella sp. UYEF19]|uniref:putative protein N(5)-glutamine methyltransferase n=1 Tax=Nakamurella sp. UYEF19 TaxID=1756392 RepID=UPI003397BF1C
MSADGPAPAPQTAQVVDRLRGAGCVFAEEEADLLISGSTSDANLQQMIDRRVAGLPLEVILGWAAFCGLRIVIEPGVFVPRRRTEMLVEQAVALGRRLPAGTRPVVLDLCCGSGAMGVAVAAALGSVELVAADIDPAAVHCAERNVFDGRVFQGDLFEPLPADLRGRIDLLVANAPYVPTNAIALMPPEARLHEPQGALDGGSDGLRIQARVIAAAPVWLARGGHLLVEASQEQAPVSMAMMAAAGLRTRLVENEEVGSTVVIGTR